MTGTAPAEGVIKFRADHRPGPLPRGLAAAVRGLGAWRDVLHRLGLVGQDPERYEGAGYGNLSVRVGRTAAAGERAFLITGTQTGGLPTLGPGDWAVVRRYDLAANRVASVGPALPSSEAMTHGAIYDLDARLGAVFHVHAPAIWRRARALGLPTTDPSVPYGTPEMAAEVRRLARTAHLRAAGVVCMGGHEDGICTFAPTPDEAGRRLVTVLARALATSAARRPGGAW